MRLTAIAAVTAFNGLLAAGLAYLWNDGARTRWAEPEALPPSIELVEVSPASEPADILRYRETIERPLFAANRRATPRKDLEAEAQAAESLKEVRLVGTYGAGTRGGIIVVSHGKVQRVAIGESIGGWKVVGGGTGRSAELVRADGKRHTLDLALNATAPSAPAEALQAGQKEAADAAQPAGSGSPADAQSGSSRRADGRAARNRPTQEEREARRRERIERINALRAQKGRPPIGQ